LPFCGNGSNTSTSQAQTRRQQMRPRRLRHFGGSAARVRAVDFNQLLVEGAKALRFG
jgi:hypothetical protein